MCPCLIYLTACKLRWSRLFVLCWVFFVCNYPPDRALFVWLCWDVSCQLKFFTASPHQKTQTNKRQVLPGMTALMPEYRRCGANRLWILWKDVHVITKSNLICDLFHEQVEETQKQRMSNYKLWHTVQKCIPGHETNLERMWAQVHFNRTDSKIDGTIKADWIKSCKTLASVRFLRLWHFDFFFFF